MYRMTTIVKALAAILFASVGCCCWGQSASITPDTRTPNDVQYDQRSFLINGNRTLLLSGSIHYARVPRADWENVILQAKEMGLNCIETYIFWNEHEPQRRLRDDDEGDHWLWEGNKDIEAFLSLIAKHQLYAVVRLGPFVGAEYHFGGLPLWLRQSGAACFRCADPIWKHEMERYARIMVNKLRPFFAEKDGPIVALQIENEYFKYDEYLKWAIAMAHNKTQSLPWILCHAVHACLQLPNHPALCSINGFWMDRGGKSDQPGPEMFSALWQQAPEQPAMWTEDQGWFDLWGLGHIVRADPLYGMARFFALGGSYHNLYMFTGGNNYGYSAGRRGVTAYAPDTVVDSFFLPQEPKYQNYQSLFLALDRHQEDLLSHPPAFPGSSLGANLTAHEYGSLIFLTNTDEQTVHTAEYRNESYVLPPHSVVMLEMKIGSAPHVIFNSSSLVTPRTETLASQLRVPLSMELSPWKAFQEELGDGFVQSFDQESPEQLNITENQSDYLYYTFQVPQAISTPMTIEPAGDGGIYYVYVNGKYTQRVEFEEYYEGATPASLVVSEKRERFLTESQSVPSNVTILSVAMGLNNFRVGPNAGKGIRSVTVDGAKISKFATSWRLRGEEMKIFSHEGRQAVDWLPATSQFSNTSLTWFQTTFQIPESYHVYAGKGQPKHSALVANMTGLNKGIFYVNGVHLGRYWLIPGHCNGDCAPPFHGDICMMRWRRCGKPTQEVYHVPFEVVTSGVNVLTVFEETGPEVGPRDFSSVKVQLIHQHPY